MAKDTVKKRRRSKISFCPQNVMPRELRVLYPYHFPMVNNRCISAHETRWCRMPGIAAEIIHLIANHMNISIVSVEHDRSFGVEDVFDKNGKFVGLFQHLQNGSADLIATTSEPLELRTVAWDFTNTLYMSETRIAVRKPDNTLSSVFDFFYVYGAYTWILMLFTFTVFTIFGLGVRCVEKKMGLRTNVNGFSLFWKMVRLQLIQPSAFVYRLRSAVVRQRKAAPFTDENILKALKENRNYLATATPNAWYYELIQLSDKDPYFAIGQILQNHGVKRVATVEESLELAETEAAIVIVQNDQYDGHISPFPAMNETFMIRKNHPLLDEINKAIEAQQVLIQRVFKKYVEYREPSLCNKNEKKKIRALSTTPFLGVLLLLAVGLSLGAFAFVIERIFEQEEHEHIH